ncbi:uncharacterized protein [Triticum aestivum]|nr:uncharacterized protein LOC123150003 isoform X2 [Triticum aestivum]
MEAHRLADYVSGLALEKETKANFSRYQVSKNADDYTRSKPCRGAASVAPLLKGKVKEGACVVLLQLATRIAVSLHKNAKKSFSETIKDMYMHYNERSGLLLCGFQT